MISMPSTPSLIRANPGKRKCSSLLGSKTSLTLTSTYKASCLDVNEEEEEEDPWKPPNGGYGWVVVIASFMMNLHFASGAQAGILILEWMKHYQVNAVTVSSLNACHTVLGRLLGLVIGPLVLRYGCRWMVFIGTLNLAGGSLATAFAPSIPVLYVTYGVMISAGMGIYFASAIVAVQEYFSTKRSLAAGIGISGLNVGYFMWPPLAAWLIKNHGWRGAYMIEATIHLVGGIIYCIMLRPPGNRKSQTGSLASRLKNKFCFWKCRKGCPERQDMETKESKTTGKSDPILGSKLDSDGETVSCNMEHSDVEVKKALPEYLIKGIRHPRQLKHGSSKSLNCESKADQHTGLPGKMETEASSEQEGKEKEPEVRDKSGSGSFCKGFCSRIPVDTRPLQSPAYVMFLLYIFFVTCGYIVNHTYIPVRSEMLGITGQRAALQVSMFGIVGGIFTPIFAAVGNIKGVNRPVMTGVGGILSGLLTIFSAWITTYVGLIVYAAMYGFLQAVFLGVDYTVIVDILGIDLVAPASGWYMVAMGIGNLVTHPLAGWMLDYTGDARVLFISLGTCGVIGGICASTVPCILWKREKRSYNLTANKVDQIPQEENSSVTLLRYDYICETDNDTSDR